MVYLLRTSSTAPDSDFAGIANSMLTVSSTSTTFAYALMDDDLKEETEMFQFVLSPGSGSDAVSVPEPTDVATISITDDDCKFLLIAITKSETGLAILRGEFPGL